MARSKARAWVGCSGFSYSHWKDGVFYPAGLPQRSWLNYYAERFETVELNVTFYRLPEAATFEGWRTRSPEGFRFAVKGSKLITHMKELKEVDEPVAQFMERAAGLGGKLGPVLWQTPPAFKADRTRLRAFVKLLGGFPGTLHAFEFRNASWFVKPVYDMVREAGMTVVSADYSANLPEPPPDFRFLYLRRHGTGARAYQGSYSDEALAEDAEMVKKAVKAGREVFIYFNNDIGGHAPRDARKLKEMLAKG
ncbi:MAG TPA: DUF72 domain-containing protein [bacterium]|nr:DUF72 domain-containing protein [bacterium]